MSDIDLSLISRITRDLTDGVMLIDTSGSIIYKNPKADELLAGADIRTGMKYAEVIHMDSAEQNDEFHQYVLDSIYEKERIHKGTIKYVYPDGSIHYFDMDSSYAFSEDHSKRMGVIVQFSDITEEYRLKIRYKDATLILVFMLFVLCLGTFSYSVWLTLGQPLTDSNMTVVMEILGAVGTILALRYTSITVADFGLGTKGMKRAIVFNSIVTGAIVAGMLILKAVLRKTGVISPGVPMFHWSNWNMGCTLYPLTVFAQEFLTRGAAQGCLKMVLPETSPDWYAIVISSMFFGALHIHRGLWFMIGAVVLLSFFGFIYQKQGTIWGLCIPHYFLGLSLPLIWGIT